MLRLLLGAALLSVALGCFGVNDSPDDPGADEAHYGNDEPSDYGQEPQEDPNALDGREPESDVPLDGEGDYDPNVRDYQPPEGELDYAPGDYGQEGEPDEAPVDYDPEDTYRGDGGPDEDDYLDTTALPSTAAPTTVPGNNLECFSFTCQFENNEPNCGFEDATLPIEGYSPFALVSGKFHNSVTGIPAGDNESKGYMATYLKKGASAVLSSRSDVAMAEDRHIRLRFYEAVAGHKFSACCDDESYCPFSSDEGVAVYSYRQWQTAEFVCPAGTTKLILKCEGLGKHQGACGVDNVDMVDEAGESLCYDAPALSGAARRKLRNRSQRHH